MHECKFICPFSFISIQKILCSSPMASGGPTFPSTRETTNYARLCRLLVSVGCQVLKETFDRIHPPGGLDTVLATQPALPKLQSLKKKRVLNLLQWDKLYPVIKSSVSSKNFDITLLMVLLRSICGLTPPAMSLHPICGDIYNQFCIPKRWHREPTLLFVNCKWKLNKR